MIRADEVPMLELSKLRRLIEKLERRIDKHGEERKELEDAKRRWADLHAEIFAVVCYRGEVQVCGVVQDVRVSTCGLKLSLATLAGALPMVSVAYHTIAARVQILVAPGGSAHFLVEDDDDSGPRDYFVRVFEGCHRAEDWARMYAVQNSTNCRKS